MSMTKKQLKENELGRATTELRNASSAVKKISKDVEKGFSTQADLEYAINDLKIKGKALKILQAETKVLSGWEVVSLGETGLPRTNSNNFIWIVVLLISAVYLAR